MREDGKSHPQLSFEDFDEAYRAAQRKKTHEEFKEAFNSYVDNIIRSAEWKNKQK